MRYLSKNRQIHADKVTSAWGRGNGELTVWWIQHFCLGWWKNSENSGNDYTTMNVLNAQNCT